MGVLTAGLLQEINFISLIRCSCRQISFLGVQPETAKAGSKYRGLLATSSGLNIKISSPRSVQPLYNIQLS